ncbi:MAG: Amino-acid carrier protein AlsT [Chlamydiales bacterium]|nr:Amino-acid carrier protein AlsT [Chlamydiales bacterium]
MFKEFLSDLNGYFTLYFIFPAILLLGAYLSVRLRFVQLSKLKMSFASLFKKSEEGAKGDISHYQAIASVLAGNFGTGNISGMAIALTMGGPGALVWMWMMAFFGAAIQYANCLLGVKYRRQNEKGEYVGGPMYYLNEGLGYKSLAALFSVCVIFGAFAVGNFAQVNSMTLPLQALGISPLIVGFGIAILVGLVILGGMQRMAKVSSAVVPAMALLYLGTAFVILALHANQITPALGLMFRSAFGMQSLVGGTFGFTMLKALTTGFDRAIFATDAGTGTVPILQAGAKTKHPVVDGVVALVSPFMVMIVCTMTALVLIITGVLSNSELQSTNLVAHAFKIGVGKSMGSFVVILALVLFGYTTALAWATCLQRAVGYLFGAAFVRPFQFLYILMIPVGALLQVDFVWTLADISLSCMLVINLIGVAGLSKEVIGDSREYFQPSIRNTHEVIE